MQHMYPLARGDPLCPLGFHPQVRWPTRCKRCFRDYKEHGGKKRDEPNLRRDSSTASTPSLSLNLSDGNSKRTWLSSSNLASENDKSKSHLTIEDSNPSSWTSTPDLANLQDDAQAVPTVSIKLPARKQKPIVSGQRTSSDSVSVLTQRTSLYSKENSLTSRAKKLKEIQESPEPGMRRIQIKEVKPVSEMANNHDVQFLIQVKRNAKYQESEEYNSGSENDDTISNAGTDTTDTTLVSPDSELREQLESLKKDLDYTKSKCDRLEREKSDILLRRLAAMETATSKTSGSEVLKLQKKCNELQEQLEDYRDEKLSLSLKVKELEADLDLRPTAQEAQKLADELRSKLLAAETLCEELMDENEDMKKELRDMEEQMDEIQDNFREDQAVEYTSMKKELDQTTKNCRILSFKLRKAERKAEQLEYEKNEIKKKINECSGGKENFSYIEKIKQLEQDIKISNEVSLRLQKELEESNRKLAESTKTSKSKKNEQGDRVDQSNKKISRESLTRGGSQDDPAQLLRDLQDSLEREADLREQLKFTEEEAENLRKKVSRIEDDNESLVLQLKKMATRAKSGRKLSPTKTASNNQKNKDSTDDEDPAEIKLQLELTEQEASVLRKKIEELESDNRMLKTKIKNLQDKVGVKGSVKRALNIGNGSSISEKKIKVLEDEANELRKKLIEKERDCERLHAELAVNQKRPKTTQKNKLSSTLDQQTLDLKRQVQVIEQEASVLRSKVRSLEDENEKLVIENKKLNIVKNSNMKYNDKNIDKYVDQIANLEIELDVAQQKIKEQENNVAINSNKNLKVNFKNLANRTPKKISALTSRDQLKSMINDLEKEIVEIAEYVNTIENDKARIEEELKKSKSSSEIEETIAKLTNANNKLKSIEIELDEEKEKTNKETRKNNALKSDISKLRETLERMVEEKKELKENVDEVNKKYKNIMEDKKDLDMEIVRLKNQLTSLQNSKEEVEQLTTKITQLNRQIEEKNRELDKLQEISRENVKLNTDISLKGKKILDLENKISKLQDKCNDYEKKAKQQSKDLEIKFENEKQKMKNLENDKIAWMEEKSNFNAQIETLNTKIKTLENTINEKEKLIKQLEDNLKQEKKLNKTNAKMEELETRKISSLKEDINNKAARIIELEAKITLLTQNEKSLASKIEKSLQEMKQEKQISETKIKQLELDLKNEKKTVDILKQNAEKENRNKEMELNALKKKIGKLDNKGSSSSNSNSDSGKDKIYQDSIERLENNLAKEQQKYDDLTAKYEILEEEHVVTKAKLVMEKETLENQQKNLKSKLESLEVELKDLKLANSTNRDTWTKEKVNLEQKIKDLSKSTYKSTDYEKQRFKALFEEKQSELEQIKKEYDLIHNQMEYMRKENDELNKKLDDYEKVNKIQRNISADSSAMEKEIKQLKIKLNSVDKAKKLDVAECRMRYESQLSLVNQELQSLQNQVLRFKREKDNYKHMLESAQKTIGELKQIPKADRQHNSKDLPHYDELEESKHKIATLEQQINCMEDELQEARLESSRLKTELISEKSSWEVRLSELHSKVNELEEEKVLNSGRTKIMGLRTKMELAWQKEREEQQRLLQETATLARDLRQTLFEVERERDKEKLEAKRKQDQLKKSTEEEQEENKRKITELHCDLLELRDAHAKLRTTNEKLRREKERYVKEREDLRIMKNDRKRIDLHGNTKIEMIIEQIDTLKQVAPELFFSKNREEEYTPTPPRRTKSKSRESSPSIDFRESSLSPEDKQSYIHRIMQKLVHTTEDLRRVQRLDEDEEDRDRLRRMGMQRATSTEAEYVDTATRYSRYTNDIQRKSAILSRGSLHRKSLSLEYNIQNDQKIWRSDNDSVSSLQSLEAENDFKRRTRDSSQDSRLSGDSTQSDIGEKKKKTSLMHKFKRLTKSRSTDDQDPDVFSTPRVLSSKSNSRNNSNSEVNNEESGSKKDLRERITGIFRRAGSSSRSNSAERKRESSSTMRPLTRNHNSKNP